MIKITIKQYLLSREFIFKLSLDDNRRKVMKKLLENKLLKHYLIISYLLPRKWEKIRDIAKTTGLSEITIRQNISEINQYILPARINSSQQRGIRLFLPPQQNGFFIFSKLYKQSLRFTLLEEIFINHYPNLTSLADKLFFSTSTLKRKIAELNQLLAPYSLSVDSSQLNIVGDERKICWFFFCFFTEKYGVSDEFMRDDALDLFDEIYREFFSYYPELFVPQRQVYAYRNKFRIMLFICFSRIRKGHLFTSQTKQTVRKDFQLSHQVCSKIYEKYKIAVTPQITYQLFYVFFNQNFAWSIEELRIKSQKNNQINQIRSGLLDLLNTIEQQEKLTVENKNDLLLYLYNATTYVWGPATILYNPNEEFFRQLNNYYTSFTQRICIMIKESLTKEPLAIYLDSSVINKYLFMLITSWISLSEQLETIAPKVKTGLFFNTSYEHNLFLKNDLQYHLGFRLDIHSLNHLTLSEVCHSANNYDLLVTDLPSLNLTECEVVSIHSNPTPEDFKNILHSYNRIVNNHWNHDFLKLQKHNSIYKY